MSIHLLFHYYAYINKKIMLWLACSQTEAALMYDAVYVYAEAVRKAGSEISVSSISCSEDNKWEFGARISELMKEASTCKGNIFTLGTYIYHGGIATSFPGVVRSL